jgi:hypothetical protein
MRECLLGTIGFCFGFTLTLLAVIVAVGGEQRSSVVLGPSAMAPSAPFDGGQPLEPHGRTGPSGVTPGPEIPA